MNASLVTLGRIPFYIPAHPILSFLAGLGRQVYGRATTELQPLSPATLLVAHDIRDINGEWFESTVDSLMSVDDVFQVPFLENILLLIPETPEHATIDKSLSSLFLELGTKTAYIVNPRPAYGLPDYKAGPYFLTNGELSQAWRIFEDTVDAFIFPTMASYSDPTQYHVPQIAGIPVPSRLYYDQPSPSKPLSGLRIAVKDVFHLKGIRTSAGSRAYQSLYPAQPNTARAVQQIIDAGGVIVGKTKTVQFASGEMARDWIDYLSPFNPRGDGYQDAGCSSTGSASCVAAYDFIDLALGTDTFGSVISPAAVQGIYGFRPSLTAISTDGTVPVSDALDTVGIMARSIDLTYQVGSVLLPMTTASTSSTVKNIFYPSDLFASKAPSYNDQILKFVREFRKYANATKTDINLDEEWKGRMADHGDTIAEYMHTACAHVQLFDCYRNSKQWHDDYMKKTGRKPASDPFLLYKWRLGKDITQDQYNTARSQMNTFAEFMKTILPTSQDGSSLESVMFAPVGRSSGVYRAAYYGHTLDKAASYMQGFGFWAQQIAVLSGHPWLTVPVSQFSYKSKVTEVEERLPLCVGVVGPKGSDKELLRLVQGFFEATPEYQGWVHTGREAFRDGDFLPPATL
ncbi:amidase signature domain-containing protein [Aspergillus transmontanensis]|uniref:Amidase signature domain-containing protein n=1 Tax=Aspergillus transmontanensis TaxID=1034304 RepID=A0A5N6VXY9_9EURO|nr:amidase signature domain-containing protein [Aspergillus transmontanensis]